MSNPTDLFGAEPDQQSLFGDSEDRLQAPPQNFAPDPERVRQKLFALLTKARASEAMPWPEREARMWQTVFPNMANWLPEDEAEQLRFEFAQEIARLSRGA